MFQACFGSLSLCIFHFSLLSFHARNITIFCRVVVIMRIGVPPPNINKVVLLRDLFVSLVYLALYLVVLCNRCFQFTSIIEPSSLTRINLVFHRLQVWVFVSVNYATLGLATCLASLDSRHRNSKISPPDSVNHRQGLGCAIKVKT